MGVIMQISSKLKLRAGLALVLVATVAIGLNKLRKNDLHTSSVMIVNRAMSSGGTGLILSSASNRSEILTNAHVCKVVKDGGLVITSTGSYQVNSIKPSKTSDLCLLSVLDNLGVNTKIAANPPALYDTVSASGHPALMPNVISTGHVSGREIIPIITEIRECSEEELKADPLLCFFIGGMPIVRYFESVLTSTTIMPGSSGSGVYNSNNDLVGVVFAGNSSFGYSWTVPYEQVRNFLEKEQSTLEENNLKQEINLFAKQPQLKIQDKIRDAKENCKNAKITDVKVKQICTIFSYDMIWHK